MWDWIAQNKQWVFSGVGVTALIVIWWLIKKLFGGRKNNPVSGDPHININVSPTISPTISNTPLPPSPAPPAPLPIRKEPGKPNICFGEIIYRPIQLRGDVWTIDMDVRYATARAVLLEVRNPAEENRPVGPTTLKAELTFGKPNGNTEWISSAPWIESYLNYRTIQVTEGAFIVVAIYDQDRRDWMAVRHDRGEHYIGGGNSMDYIMLPVTEAYVPLQVRLISYGDDRGSVICTGRYEWRHRIEANQLDVRPQQ